VKLIQPILISLLFLVMLAYFMRIRSRLVDRALVIFLGTCGIVMVTMPEWTNKLAHWFGVGRGADLLLYFGLVGLGFISVLLYAKLRVIESRLTELARAIALENARVVENLKDKE
jgi:hypothetical protein